MRSASGLRPERDRRRSRADGMAMAYAGGATLDEIGAEHSLTRERVRQILLQAGYDPAQLKKKARAARRERAQREYGEAIREMLAKEHTPGEVSAGLRVPIVLVKDIDAEDPSYARTRKLVRSKSSCVKYTDDEILDCLREANDALGGILASGAYDEFMRGRKMVDGRLWPTHQTGLLRFGSWREALERAGLPANASSPVAGRRVFSIGHCIDAILEVERAVGHLPTAAEYERYASEMGGVLPSLATVRNRFGGWRHALEAAAAFSA
jgi:hypothetical protein